MRSGWLVSALVGCAGTEKAAGLSRAERLDPSACASCHPDHYREWAGSMHAYAAEDPVFVAMNAHGQRETNGELGSFCVQCHAPVALAEGATVDGTDLDTVDPALLGVTCVACHQAVSVDDDHNNAITRASDTLFRGPLDRPFESTAHGHEKSPLLDRDEPESASMCGSCHDVVTPAGVHLERTYLEWQHSLYSIEEPGLQQTCGSCHMPGREGRAAAVDGAPVRRIHSHAMPGVDVALTDFVDTDLQRALVQDALDSTVMLQLELFDYGLGSGVTVALDNIAAGHDFPSGAAHDRRAWVEVVARDATGAVVWSTGQVAEGQPLRDAIALDPNLWWLGDWTFDESGDDAHMFWEVATIEEAALVAPSRFDPSDPLYEEAHVARTFDMGDVHPTTVEAAVHIRPIGLDVLDVLVEAGDLDPSIRSAMPTFTLGGSVTTATLPAEEPEGE